MNIFGFDIDNGHIQSLVTVVLVGVVTLFAVLRLYLYLTCGKFRSNKNMEGKTVIVTGANSGIGKETARALAKLGARVIMACRNLETANAAKDEIISDSDNPNVLVHKLDLSSQQSVRQFAAMIHQTETKLDVLIHNAGMALSFTDYQSVDDIELTMATNHYGPFLLTHLLIDLLKKSAPARIVVVASKGYILVRTKVNPNYLKRFYTGANYFESKMANILFTLELSRRLKGTGVTANCLHPGVINSNIFRGAILALKLTIRVLTPCLKSEEEGAATTVFVATSPKLVNVSGKYFQDCKETRLQQRVINSTGQQIRLWDISKAMVKLTDQDPKI